MITESNGRYDGDFVKLVLETDVFMDPSIGPIEYFKDHGVIKSGISLFGKRKKQYILSSFGSLQNRKLRLYRKITTSCESVSVNRVILEMRDEFCRFSWPDEDTEDKDSIRFRRRKRVTASAKGGRGQNDDMSITVMMMVYFNNFCQKLDLIRDPKRARQLVERDLRDLHLALRCKNV